MRIKRTDKNFTVRQKADRHIHYAGQEKKYTKNTVNLSPKGKQDALRQRNPSGMSTGTKIQKQAMPDSGMGEVYVDGTGKSCHQEQGSSRNGDYAALGNIHLRKQRKPYRQEHGLHGEQPSGERQTQQYQYQYKYQQQQQIHHPSAYRENTIKTKEPALHRKTETPSGIRRMDSFSLKAHKGKRGNIQKPELPESPGTWKAGNIQKPELPETPGTRKAGFIQKSQPAKTVGELKTAEEFSAKDTGTALPASGYAQSFTDRRKGQISRYKKRKFLKSQKMERRGREAYRKTDTDRKTGTVKTQETYAQEAQMLQVQNTVAEVTLPQTQNNLPAPNASHIHTRNAGDSIRQREGDIPGRKDGTGRKDKKSKRSKGKNKDAKKDNSRSSSKNRKDRAAALRLLSYASDKFSLEEEKDSLLKVVKDLLAGKVKAAATNALLSIGAALLPALIPAFIMVLIITLLFNSPFSILLPKLSEEPGAVEILTEYTEDFREKVQEELADPGSGDETELIYEDYEGDGEPDNMADILMVYMVKHGFGDTATVMTEKNKRALKDTFDEMTSMSITYRREIVEQSYEEEDFYGNVTIRTEEVEIKIKEVRITLLTSEDIIRTGIFTEKETEILRYLMSPEILENIEGLTGGYGSPGAGSLTPEEAERLNLGGDVGSQAVKNALARLGKPYSQAKRDSGDYYDCSSLTYYAYKEAGITLSYYGSNTAASQGKLLSDRGCEVDYEDIQPGDLIFYSFTRNGRYQNISHVAVYAGNGYLVDASSSKGCVVFRPVYSTGKIVMCGRPSGL